MRAPSVESEYSKSASYINYPLDLPSWLQGG